MHNLLEDTVNIDASHLKSIHFGNFEPLTEIGKRALRLMQQGLEFRPGNFLSVCQFAEARLIENIDPTNVSDPSKTSPVIVTNQGSPVAIIKTLAERSSYALTTDSEHGLIESCFSEPTPYNRWRSRNLTIPFSDHAWSITIEEAGSFLPRRFSFFSIPVEERAPLANTANEQYANVAISATHEYIRTRAEAMLAETVPLEIEPASLVA